MLMYGYQIYGLLDVADIRVNRVIFVLQNNGNLKMQWQTVEVVSSLILKESNDLLEII